MATTYGETGTAMATPSLSLHSNYKSAKIIKTFKARTLIYTNEASNKAFRLDDTYNSAVTHQSVSVIM